MCEISPEQVVRHRWTHTHTRTHTGTHTHTYERFHTYISRNYTHTQAHRHTHRHTHTHTNTNTNTHSKRERGREERKRERERECVCHALHLRVGDASNLLAARGPLHLQLALPLPRRDRAHKRPSLHETALFKPVLQPRLGVCERQREKEQGEKEQGEGREEVKEEKQKRVSELARKRERSERGR